MSQESYEDYEDWDSNGTSFMTHIVAGSSAGLMEHLVMYPVDTIKTHLQAQRGICPDRSIVSATSSLLREGGFMRLWRGASSMLMGCVPSHALYFTVYEETKEAFGGNGIGHHPLAAAASGSLATIFHDAIMTPLDVAKQRLQLGFYNSLTDCLRKTVITDGVRGLYVSYPTTLLMNVPYGGVLVACNESLKLLLNPTGEQNLPAFLVAGGLSGACAAAVTNPLDVVKTRLQTESCILSADVPRAEPQTPVSGRTNSVPEHSSKRISNIITSSKSGINQKISKFSNQNSTAVMEHHTAASNAQASGTSVKTSHHTVPGSIVKNRMVSNMTLCPNPKCPTPQPHFKGLLSAIAHIHAEEGWRGFARGITPRLMVHAPAMSISWATYETIKRMLHSTEEPGL